METIDETGLGGIRLIQDTEGFRYGIDAVLLADFAKDCCPTALRSAELGSGNGIVSLLLASQNERRRVVGIEFQQDAAELAARNAGLNGLSDRVGFYCRDITELQETNPEFAHAFELVVSNPPYIAGGSGIPGANEKLLRARQETTADLDRFLETAAWLLKDRGSFCLVHRPFRLADIFCACRKASLEPKRIRFVHPRRGEPPNIVLLYCVRGGGVELKYDEPLYVRAGNGYSSRIREIYGR